MSAADEAGVDVDIVKYMLKAERPDRATLESIVAKLEDPVEDLVRKDAKFKDCLLYTSPSPRDRTRSRMPSSA